MVTRLKFSEIKRVSAYIGETRPPLSRSPSNRIFGKSGRGQRRGKSNGISAPDQVEGSEVFSDAVNGVPATALVKLAGRAIQGRRCLSALVGGAPAVCTADNEFRLRRHRRRGHSSVLYAYAGVFRFFHLIGKVGSVRHHRGWQAQDHVGASWRGMVSVSLTSRMPPKMSNASWKEVRPFRCDPVTTERAEVCVMRWPRG